MLNGFSAMKYGSGAIPNLSIIQTERLKLPNVKLRLNQGLASWHYWQQKRLPVIRKQVRLPSIVRVTKLRSI